MSSGLRRSQFEDIRIGTGFNSVEITSVSNGGAITKPGSHTFVFKNGGREDEQKQLKRSYQNQIQYQKRKEATQDAKIEELSEAVAESKE